MTIVGTAPTDLPLLAPGARVAVRDEDWLITQVQDTRSDGRMLKAIGLSELVRDQGATFFTNLDVVVPQRPEDTKLVLDKTPAFRRSRLYLDALLRRTPLPITETRPAIGHRQLLDEVEYQKSRGARARATAATAADRPPSSSPNRSSEPKTAGSGPAFWRSLP